MTSDGLAAERRATRVRTTSGMSKRVVALLLAALVIAAIAGWYWPRDDGQPLDSPKSLWFASDVPQVGAIVRLSYADRQHTLVNGATYLDATLSDRYRPVAGTTSDEKLLLSNKVSVSLGVDYLKKGGAAGAAKIGAGPTLDLKVSGERVLQWRSLDDLQSFFRQFDGKGAPTDAIHELYAQINQAGDEQRKTKAVTSYWVVTKVFTASSVEYSTEDSNGVSANASCGQAKSPCVIPAANLTASLDAGKDKQNVVSGADRPIFVVIKPISTNSRGMIYIDGTAEGPGVIHD